MLQSNHETNERKGWNSMQSILVVEDDRELNRGIQYMLEKEGYRTVGAYSMSKAKEIVLKTEVHLILLDVNLSDGEGFTFCHWVKSKYEVLVIFLTARDLEEDAIKGYELGAEDYVVKPFSMKILLKKIAVVLKRKIETGDRVFSDKFLKIDFGRAKVEVKGNNCAVTPTEIKLLQEFLANRGRLLTYDMLLVHHCLNN